MKNTNWSWAPGLDEAMKKVMSIKLKFSLKKKPFKVYGSNGTN